MKTKIILYLFLLCLFAWPAKALEPDTVIKNPIIIYPREINLCIVPLKNRKNDDVKQFHIFSNLPKILNQKDDYIFHLYLPRKDELKKVYSDGFKYSPISARDIPFPNYWLSKEIGFVLYGNFVDSDDKRTIELFFYDIKQERALIGKKYELEKSHTGELDDRIANEIISVLKKST